MDEEQLIEEKTTVCAARGLVRSPDGTRIAYERYGDGPPVILVSGALGTAGSERPLAGLLARRFSVVAYDRRGRGASGDEGPYAVEREIADLAALVDAVGGAAGTAAVHGTACGGALALAAAAAGVPVGPVSVYEPPYGSEAAARRGRVRALLDRGRRGEALDLLLGDGAGLPAQPRPVLEALTHTLAYDDAVVGDGSVPAARLGRVHARVLVVDGGASPSWTRRVARTVAATVPRGRHRTLTGQTHQVAPHVLAPVIEEFLEDCLEQEPAGR
ncbi:alpha/beta fold hydrolase [Streptomyces roseicoloratus]|uniref:alpha/beta fold hydrolase n=1 Tax=Streptomyces roseicoloratus TaxID=2508722 RepID=UPI001009EA4A|nr:alpha/beta fold hydrolase [Streptomyces roseicoloratus]